MIEKREYGTDFDGKTVDLYTLTNAVGMSASIMTHGAAIVHVNTKDRDGNVADVSLGYDDMAGYKVKSAYFGGTLGQFANRIAEGKFTLDGEEIQVTVNRPPTHLHGGERGFDKRLWTVEETIDGDSPSIRLSYLCADGEEGYPGNVSVSVTYTLHADNGLELAYSATTDKKTIINLSNHVYFNLNGNGVGTILDHELQVNAENYVRVGETLIPTGEIASVEGTPLDFRSMKRVGDVVDADFDQIKNAGGVDQSFVVGRETEGELVLASTIRAPENGRVLKTYTTEPAVHFYSGNFLDGSIVGKGGVPYTHRTAFCMETQHYPDSPNHANFPSTVLLPGDVFSSRTIYKFETD
ncbi:MAG: galactose mutarotase [Pontiella sp.]|nr:galactose mutarotase [Pontiella sp.]